MKQDFILALTTVSDLNIAKLLSEQILEQQIAGCINTIKIENSSYFWEGKIQNDPEYLLIIKTITPNISQLESFLAKHHPYQNHFFTVIKPEHVSEPYYAWLTANINS